MYSSLLASCGYDRKVIIWKETNGTWAQIYEYSNHDSSGEYKYKIQSSLAVKPIISKMFIQYMDGLVQDWSNSSVLAMELLKSCAKPSIYTPSLAHEVEI